MYNIPSKAQRKIIPTKVGKKEGSNSGRTCWRMAKTGCAGLGLGRGWEIGPCFLRVFVRVWTAAWVMMMMMMLTQQVCFGLDVGKSMSSRYLELF